MNGRSGVDLVEFATLNDLFCFIMANSEPGQQFLSVTKYKGHVYTVTPRGDLDTVLFTREEPKASVYVCEEDAYDFAPAEKPSRSKLNILILEVSRDTLADSLFSEADTGAKARTRKAQG